MGKHEDCADCAEHKPCPVWDSADFYDCDDSAERLRHDEPDDAIADHLDTLDGDVYASVMGPAGSLEVFAYAHDPGPDLFWCTEHAKRAVEHVEENFAENYGDPEGDGEALNDEQRKELVQRVGVAFFAFFHSAEVWTCSQVASRTYDAEQLAPFREPDDDDEDEESDDDDDDAEEVSTP